jgi:hypothetical protein
MLYDLLPELSGCKSIDASKVVEELITVPLHCIAKILYEDVSLHGFVSEDFRETGQKIDFKI